MNVSKISLFVACTAVIAGAVAYVGSRNLTSRATNVVAAERPAAEAVPADLPDLLSEILRDPGYPTAAKSAAAQVKGLPQSSDAWTRLGDVLTAQAHTGLDTSLYKKTERIYLRAHQLDSANTDALVGLSWAAGAAHRFDDSVAWANLAIKNDPTRAAAYGILGDAAVELGRYEEAANDYQKMLDLHPDLAAYSRAAHLLYVEGNVPRAMAMIRKAIDAAGGEPERAAWCVAEYGSMLCHEGAAPMAVRLVDEWLKRAPENVTLLNASGQAHAAANDDAGAIAAYEKALSHRVQHATLAALFDLYRSQGRIADANTVVTRVEELHQFYRTQGIQGGEGQLARFYADAGVKLDEAQKLAEVEYSHHRTASAADTLAWVYLKAGRTSDAAKLIPEIVRRRVPDATMLYHVAMIESASEDTTSCRRHLAAALSREPRFNPVHAVIARQTLQQLGSIPTQVAVAP